MKEAILLLLSVCLFCPTTVHGHGYMVDPISRSATKHTSVTSRAGYTQCDNGAINWTPQGNFCGGRTVQENNGGNCSACGDNYATSYPRPHDYGGQYATSIVPTRIYLVGQMITIKVKVTASHLGHFLFRLCDRLESNYPNQDALTQCFNTPGQPHILYDEYGNSNFSGINQATEYNFEVYLPNNITCPDGCSLQWWYETNNSPGSFPEHFVNCADIRIVNCDQYLDENNDMSYCGFGPTPELEYCSEGGGDTGGESSSGESSNTENSNDDNSNTGSSNSGGYTNNNGGYGENSGGYTNNNDGYGDSSEGYGNDNYGNENQNEGGNYYNEGSGNQNENEGTNTGSGSGTTACPTSTNCQTAPSGSGPPSCEFCTRMQCASCQNDCCSKETSDVYLSTLTGAPDLWCDYHCTDDPTFCPRRWCYSLEAVRWVDTCSTKKSVSSLINKLETKIEEIKKKRRKGKSLF